MNLFWLILQYKFLPSILVDRESKIKEIVDNINNSNLVWQKFAQLLSYHEDLIGAELAIELQKLLYDCPAHEHAYSAKIIRQDFGSDLDTDQMEMIGSGTIAQVYKIWDITLNKHVVVKIKHPNADKDILEALSSYENVRNSYFMPIKFKCLCDFFFQGLKQQVNMKRELRNCETISSLFEKRSEKKNNLYVFPVMLRYSRNCVIMTYEPSTPIVLDNRANISNEKLYKTCVSMVYFWFLCVHHGFLHADLHYGNFGISGDKIVVYDFGFMCDIRDIDADERALYVKDNLARNSRGVAEFAFLNEKDHDKHLTKIISRLAVTDDIQTDYEENMEMVIRYIITKDVKIAESKMNIFVFSEKLIPISKVMKELEKTPECANMNKQIHCNSREWIKTNFPYDDVVTLYT